MKALALAVGLVLGFSACSSMQPTANTTEVQFVLAKAPA